MPAAVGTRISKKGSLDLEGKQNYGKMQEVVQGSCLVAWMLRCLESRLIRGTRFHSDTILCLAHERRVACKRNARRFSFVQKKKGRKDRSSNRCRFPRPAHRLLYIGAVVHQSSLGVAGLLQLVTTENTSTVSVSPWPWRLPARSSPSPWSPSLPQ
jgi:hypothetical protein